MFTGLIECTGRVELISQETPGVYRMGISASDIATAVRLGDSVAVSGVCLTVTAVRGASFDVQMMKETMRATRLGELKSGDRVNLERALRLGDRLDGHIVSGHVDGVGTVLDVEVSGETRVVRISVPDGLAWGIAPKGSIALDGVSLTVIGSTEREFSVGLIPTTLRETTVSELKGGDRVNIEIDLIARYVAQLAAFGVRSATSERESITWNKLSEYGWL